MSEAVGIEQIFAERGQQVKGYGEEPRKSYRLIPQKYRRGNRVVKVADKVRMRVIEG
jgi:hypothetical protein